MQHLRKPKVTVYIQNKLQDYKTKTANTGKTKTSQTILHHIVEGTVNNYRMLSARTVNHLLLLIHLKVKGSSLYNDYFEITTQRNKKLNCIENSYD